MSKCPVMVHLHQGQSAVFLRPVPCGNSDLIGSAMNYSVVKKT